MRDAKVDEEIEITGDHGPSKKEIPMAVELLGNELLGVEEKSDGSWAIRIRKR